MPVNYLLMHLDDLVATHGRKYKDKGITKVIGGQRSGGDTCSLLGVSTLLLTVSLF